jgi:glycosyltransferase involved in cell wall biosynthesis
MNRTRNNGVFISWMNAVPRSKGIAEAIGIRDFYIERLKGAPMFLLPLRYLLQALETRRIIWRERPQLIIAMNPPIVLPLLVYLAARLLKAKFVIDSHTGAFDGRWRRYLLLHKFLSRRALATIVTNAPLRALVERWGATALILEDRVPDLPLTETIGTNNTFTVGVISSFAPDEPVDAVIAAARNVSDVRFLITGRVPRRLARNVGSPGNVSFTGYLPRTEYVALLHRVDVLMVLVKRDLTLLCGAYEAVAVGKPLITSDWPVLRKYFRLGTLYVDNTPEGIQEAVKKAAQCQAQLRAEMRQLKNSLDRHWNRRFQAFCSHIRSVLGPGVIPGIGENLFATTHEEVTNLSAYAQPSADALTVDR